MSVNQHFLEEERELRAALKRAPEYRLNTYFFGNRQETESFEQGKWQAFLRRIVNAHWSFLVNALLQRDAVIIDGVGIRDQNGIQPVDLYFSVSEPAWTPETNLYLGHKQHPRMPYFAQTLGLYIKKVNHLFMDNYFSQGHEEQDFWFSYHQLFMGWGCDLLSFLMTHFRPALIMLKENGNHYIDAKGGKINDAMLSGGPLHSAEMTHQFFQELKLKYPDLPVIEGEDCSFWYLLHKMIHHEQTDEVVHDRAWSYALDLGILNARFVAIDLTRPLGMRILEEIQTGKIDNEHRLYREFYIYCHGDYLFALLRDVPYPPWSLAFDEKQLEDVTLDWRPESLMGYDYTGMELIHVPPKRSEGEHPGWYFFHWGLEYWPEGIKSYLL